MAVHLYDQLANAQQYLHKIYFDCLIVTMYPPTLR